MNKEIAFDLMSETEFNALEEALDEKCSLDFPISRGEAFLMKKVLDSPNRGIKDWFAKSVSKKMSRFFEGYRNVFYFIEKLELID